MRRVVKYTSPGKYLTVVHYYVCLPNKPVVETAGQLLFTWLLAHCRITGAPVKYTDSGEAA
jgi:hypothetical protein